MLGESENTGEGNKRIELFGLPLDVGIDSQYVIQRVSSGNLLISYLNPYAYKVTRRNSKYSSNLHRLDLVVCDGLGVQIAVKKLFKIDTPILTPDFYGIGHDYLEAASNLNMSLCLVGAEQEVSEKIAGEIRSKFPGFGKITSFCGYGSSPAMAKQFILQNSPDMVLVGLGMGYQESYLLTLVDAGWSGVGICVGGFLDKIAKPELQYPDWTEKFRLRFLGRILAEPRRLSRRYIIDYLPFIRMYLKGRMSRSRGQM